MLLVCLPGQLNLLDLVKVNGNANGTAAALNVTEPTSTGIGGDVFCLFYDAKERKIRGLNGSGRAPSALTLDRARSDLGLRPLTEGPPPDGEGGIPMNHVHAVTVPGTAAAWIDVIDTFGSGKLTLSDVLSEGIRLADEGAPISLFSSVMWAQEVEHLKNASPNYKELLKSGTRAPREGDIMRLPGLAETFRELCKKGKSGFYEGRVAEAIVEVIKGRGGVMSMEDLKRHGETGSEMVDPISIDVGEYKLWECTPNGQGLVALMALGILEILQEEGKIPKFGEDKSVKHNSAE